MAQLIRTTSENPDFQKLVVELDHDLAVRDGEEHSFYAQFNKISGLQHVIVAYDGNVAVGCGAFKPLSDEIAEIKRMYVLPEHRGQGLAGKILSALESWAQESGFECCRLETGKKQPEAIALYRKSLYAIIPNYGQYEGVANSVCFEKKL